MIEQKRETEDWDWIIVNKYDRAKRSQLFRIREIAENKKSEHIQNKNPDKIQDKTSSNLKYSISCYKSYVTTGYGARAKQESKYFDIGGVYPGPGEKVFAGRWKGSGYGHSYQTFGVEVVNDVNGTRVKLKTVRNLVLGIGMSAGQNGGGGGAHLVIHHDTGSSSQFWKVLD